MIERERWFLNHCGFFARDAPQQRQASPGSEQPPPCFGPSQAAASPLDVVLLPTAEQKVSFPLAGSDGASPPRSLVRRFRRAQLGTGALRRLCPRADGFLTQSDANEGMR